ncbi:chromosomal replication initiator DnaA [Roseovarius sp. HI0049]|nr:chromosomal replication initiator DnaA [Roseovarius sp. HI0049]
MARQLSFDLPVRTALGRDDFFVSQANATAVAMIEGWRTWPARKLVLTGPRGAGKTHLAHVWAAQSGARIIPARGVAAADIPALAAAPVAVEDCDAIAGDRAAEDALFHLHNLALAEGQSLLFTAAAAPNHWRLALPDLASRMQGTPTVQIAPPDDELLMAVMMKLFSDRQLSPAPATLPYLTKRIDRSFDAARDIVERLDAAALEQRRPINTKLAGELLDNNDT